MKFLFFECRGERYCVHENGNLTKVGHHVSNQWKFLGVSFHHWKQTIEVTCEQAFNDPKTIIGGLVWDKDHGTIRQWGGKYNGKLPRITSARIN